MADAVFFFMLPSHVSVGSGAALAMVLSNFIPLSLTTITLIMNVGLLIIGAYDNTPRRELIAIVDKQEYRQLMDYVRDVDPKVFVTVYSVSEMRYLSKK